jgi:hypothetical protein
LDGWGIAWRIKKWSGGEELDRAEGLRAKRRKAIEVLDELAQFIFLEMFGDPPHSRALHFIFLN